MRAIGRLVDKYLISPYAIAALIRVNEAFEISARKRECVNPKFTVTLSDSQYQPFGYKLPLRMFEIPAVACV